MRPVHDQLVERRGGAPEESHHDTSTERLDCHSKGHAVERTLTPRLWAWPRRRALEFTFRDYDGYLGYLKRAREDGLIAEEGCAETDRIIAGIPPDRLEWIIERLNDLSTSGRRITVSNFRRRPHKTSDTRIVMEAAKALDPPPPDGYGVGAHLVSAWQFLSGFAHGLTWPAVGDWKVHDQDHESGKLTVSVQANPDRLLDAAFFAVVVIEKAISRWRDLCAPGCTTGARSPRRSIVGIRRAYTAIIRRRVHGGHLIGTCARRGSGHSHAWKVVHRTINHGC
jgi:hypothetical protein